MEDVYGKMGKIMEVKCNDEAFRTGFLTPSERISIKNCEVFESLAAQIMGGLRSLHVTRRILEIAAEKAYEEFPGIEKMIEKRNSGLLEGQYEYFQLYEPIETEIPEEFEPEDMETLYADDGKVLLFKDSEGYFEKVFLKIIFEIQRKSLEVYDWIKSIRLKETKDLFITPEGERLAGMIKTLGFAPGVDQYPWEKTYEGVELYNKIYSLLTFEKKPEYFEGYQVQMKLREFIVGL